MQTGLIGTITCEPKNYQAINCLAISRDGKILASDNGNGKIKLWNLQTRTLIRTLPGHGGEVWSVAISPDGQTIASSSTDYSYLTVPGGDTDNIKLWNARTGKLIRSFSGHFAKVRAIAISPIVCAGGRACVDEPATCVFPPPVWTYVRLETASTYCQPNIIKQAPQLTDLGSLLPNMCENSLNG